MPVTLRRRALYVTPTSGLALQPGLDRGHAGNQAHHHTGPAVLAAAAGKPGRRRMGLQLHQTASEDAGITWEAMVDAALSKFR